MDVLGIMFRKTSFFYSRILLHGIMQNLSILQLVVVETLLFKFQYSSIPQSNLNVYQKSLENKGMDE